MAHPQFRQQRTMLIRSIKQQLKPNLRPSAFNRSTAAGTRPLQLWVPRRRDGSATEQSFALKGGYLLTQFEGFTEDGVITDAFAGGLATTDYSELPLEDLLTLHGWVVDKLPKLTGLH